MTTGPELIDEIGKEPTLDRLMQRNIRAQPMTDAEFGTLIANMRSDRASFNLKDEKKRAKRQGIEEPDGEGSDNE